MLLLLLNILFLASLAWWGWRKASTILKAWYWPSLLLHASGGFAIGALYYLYYKEGDTLHFFNESLKLNQWAQQDFVAYTRFIFTNTAPAEWLQQLYYTDARALFMTKVVSVSTLLSGGNYWTSSLHFSMLSFGATWWWCHVLVSFYPDAKRAVIFSFLLLPSVVLWSSGLVKESVAMAAIYSLLVVFIKTYYREKLKIAEWCLMPLALWCLYMLKYYYVAVLFPVLITALVHQRYMPLRVTQSFALQLLSWLGIFATLTLTVSQLHPNLHPSGFLHVLYDNYLQFLKYSHPDDVMTFSFFEETWWSVAVLSPWAFVSGAFRPFLWEATNLLQVLASIENFTLLVLAVGALPALRRIHSNPNRMLIFAALVYCLVLGAFLALSTPNFGTLIRYRVGFLSFFVFIITVSNPIFKKISDWLAERGGL